MRRRSERKKSVDPSPVTPSRRSSRRTSRRTPEVEKVEDLEHQADATPTKTDSSPNRASSEERVESSRRGRATRSTRAPANRRLRSLSGAENKIDSITEEENGLTPTIEEKDSSNVDESQQNVNENTTILNENKDIDKKQTEITTANMDNDTSESGNTDDIKSDAVKVATKETVETVEADAQVETTAKEEEEKSRVNNYEFEGDVEMKNLSACEAISNSNEQDKNKEVLITGKQEEGIRKNPKSDDDDEPKENKESATTSKEATPETTVHFVDSANVSTNVETQQTSNKNRDNSSEYSDKTPNGKYEHEEITEKENDKSKEEVTAKKQNTSEEQKQEKQQKSQNIQENKSSDSELKNKSTSVEQTRTRKRKWLSKKTTQTKETILAISTDSLKNLIADVQPVPLSDVKLESSSEVEEVPSEHNAREISSSPSDHDGRRNSLDTIEKIKVVEVPTSLTSNVPRAVLPLQSSPSPPRNQTSNVLFITNLVRPFTVMQLKGLLARTGKIVENGFWIDRIKSKCFVQYETEEYVD